MLTIEELNEIEDYGFIEMKPVDLNENAVKLIGADWMLITAGSPEHYNTMTANWGSMGYLWHKPVMFIFVRPQRYTFEFIEDNEYFTCSFFEEKYRDKLSFCGTYSGRDCDKATETGITPFRTLCSIGFIEAKYVIECRKIYFQDIQDTGFTDQSFKVHYPENDFHRMYIGEITSVKVKKEAK
ncbi:MAG TPA: flavin reductase [Lentimicrobium sp.]|nr:flavin reductase [Lentimicrobium sp.]